MNAFLVHGAYGKPFENWFPWLEAELCKKDLVCTVPSFPTPAHQNFQNWEALMDYYVRLGFLNEETVLIGHSCGAVFSTHYLLKHRLHVKGLILVSGYNNYFSGDPVMDGLNESFFMSEAPLDMCRFADKVHVFYSDNDPYFSKKVLEDFAASVGGTAHFTAGAGHFNEAAGFTECEAVLEAVMDCLKENAS